MCTSTSNIHTRALVFSQFCFLYIAVRSILERTTEFSWQTKENHRKWCKKVRFRSEPKRVSKNNFQSHKVQKRKKEKHHWYYAEMLVCLYDLESVFWYEFQAKNDPDVIYAEKIKLKLLLLFKKKPRFQGIAAKK